MLAADGSQIASAAFLSSVASSFHELELPDSLGGFAAASSLERFEYLKHSPHHSRPHMIPEQIFLHQILIYFDAI
mgnify:CR=1 FL=1